MAYFLRSFLFLLILATSAPSLRAQNTINTVTLPVSSVCPGSQISVYFQPSGSLTTNTTYVVQLSDGGAYNNIATSPASLTSYSGTGHYVVTATIPANQPAGTTYSLRVTASTPAVIGTPSATKLTIKTKPAPPTVLTETFDCQKADGSNNIFSFISVTATAPNTTFQLYNQDGSIPIGITRNSSGFVVPKGGGTITYYVTQQVDGCESDKVPTKLTIKPKANVYATPLNIYGHGGQEGPYGRITYCQGAPSLSIKEFGLEPIPDNIVVLYRKESGDLEFEGFPPKPKTDKSGSAVYSFITSLDGCPSTLYPYGRLTVTVNPRPAKPTVATSAVSLCQFQQAPPLNATTTATGGALVWYTNATGGTGASAAPQLSTASAGTFKYYVAQKLNDCEGDRVEITVDVKAASPAPTVSEVNYCQGAQTSPLSAVAASGGTLNWYASASGGTGSAAAPTPSTNNAGVQTFYVAQTVGTNCESQRVPLKVTVYSPPPAPTVAKATYTFCQYSQGEALSATGQNLKWYETASGGTGVSSITPGTASAGLKSYYVSQTVLGCEGPRTTITVDVLAAPAPPTPTQTSYEFCQGTVAVISGTIAPGVAASWYIYDNEPGLTNIYTDGNKAYATISTEQARTLQYSLFQTASNGCKGNASPIINITVKPAPAPPGVTSVAVCQNASAPVLSATGDGLRWYTAQTGGTGSATTPVVSTSQASKTTYYVTQTQNGCESQRAALVVTVNPIPATPGVASNGPVYCQYATAQSLTASGQNLKWYDAPSGGNGVETVSPNTTVVGSKSYYVSQTVLGCEGPRTAVSVTVKEVPTAPIVQKTAYSFCAGATNTIITADLNGESSAYNWYGNGGQPALTNITNTGNIVSATVPTNQVGTFTYWITRTANGCESVASQKIVATINAIPAAPGVTPVAVCQNATAPALQSAGEGLLWYAVETGGTGSTTTPGVNTSQPGQFNYYVSQTVNGCEGQRATLTATVKPLPGPPIVTAGPVYCQNVPAQSLTAVGQNLNWYRDASGGTSLGSSVTPETNTAGSVTYYVSQNIDGCEGSRVGLVVKVNPAPALPTATTAYSYCQKTPAVALAAQGSGLKWYDASGKSIDTAPTPSTDAPGTVSYFVTQSAEGCESNRLEIKITTKPTPSAPSTVALSFCQNAAAPRLQPTGVNLLWYTTEAGGTGSATTPGVNTSQPGQTNYYVSQTLDGCESSRSTLSVTTKPLPAAPGVTQRDVCQFANPESVTAIGTNLTWYNADGSQFSQTPIINTGRGGASTYQVTQTVNGCEGPKATLSVNVLTTPIPAVTKTVVELCQGTTAQPLDATGTSLVWTSPTGVMSNTAPAPSTAQPTQADGDTYYVTQTGTNGCTSDRAVIRVFVQTAPTLTVSGGATVNLGTEVPLKLTFTGVGPYRYKLSDGTAGTATKDTVILVLPTQTTLYQVAEVTNKCGSGQAGSNTSTTVAVLVPTIQTRTLTSTSLCVGSSLSTGFQTTGAFNSGSVFKLQIARAEADTTKLNFTDVTSSTATNGQISGVIPTTLAAGTYRVRVTATNPKIPINGTLSPSVLTVRAGATATLAGTQNIFEGQTAKLSVALTGDAPWTFTYRDSTSTGLGAEKQVQTTDNPYVLTIQPLRTTAYFLTSVGNACGITATARTLAVVSVAPLLGIEDPSLAEAVEIYPVPATTTLTVRVRGLSAKETAVFQLTDQSGRVTGQYETKRETSLLPLDQQPAGVYILRIQVGDRTASKRIVKL